MGLFGRNKKDLVLEGLTGSAVVKNVGDPKWHSDKDDAHLSDFGIGNVKWPLVLEVTVDDGRAPSRVDRTFKVPASSPDASRQQMVTGWVSAAKGGQTTRAQFDEAIDGAVKGGLLTDAEADAARASLG